MWRKAADSQTDRPLQSEHMVSRLYSGLECCSVNTVHMLLVWLAFLLPRPCDQKELLAPSLSDSGAFTSTLQTLNWGDLYWC